MLKKYVTKLPDGRKTQYAALLGRQILLTDGNIVNESLLTQIYSSYFKEIKNTEKSIKEEPIIEKVEEQEEEQVSEVVGDFDVLLPEEPKETEEITMPKPKGRRKKNS